ncbi:MAG: DUF2520 domain-containing protein [Bacteroidales bacterium]|jgi:predicted short-subunit dehydrogenase-like oxidoreductase (DUF2520 family)|nr:DUF2520 domain-containing protein [Bacteroidales bacterium]
MKAVIIGAGNVGTHLAIALKNEGIHIVQVVSRTMKSALELASRMECAFTTDIETINTTADIYIISVSDRAILQVIRQLSPLIGNKFMVHTSGSVGIDVFYDFAINYGVVYPLQTFSKFKEINYSEIPIFIESNSQENQAKLYQFAKKITPHVQVADSDQRAYLHLCAVFSCNFTNHLCAIAEMLLQKKQLNFDSYRPLLRETFDKISKYSPYISQTGPAVRNDVFILEKHLELLKDYPEIQKIYGDMSQSIIDFHSKDEQH